VEFDGLVVTPYVTDHVVGCLMTLQARRKLPETIHIGHATGTAD
jgi:hypothetical protein